MVLVAISLAFALAILGRFETSGALDALALFLFFLLDADVLICDFCLGGAVVMIGVSFFLGLLLAAILELIFGVFFLVSFSSTSTNLSILIVFLTILVFLC